MTGIGIGMSLNNNPCVMMHQRLDFFLVVAFCLPEGFYTYEGPGRHNVRSHLVQARTEPLEELPDAADAHERAERAQESYRNETEMM